MAKMAKKKAVAGKGAKEQPTPLSGHNKIIDDDRMYTESGIGDPPGEPPRTPPRQMILDAASAKEVELALIPPPDDPYKTIAWVASAQDFVRYTGNYRGKSIIAEIGQIDLALFTESGDYYFQSTYVIQQKGELWCNTGALSLRKLYLHLLDKGDALVLTIPIAFKVHGQRRGDTGPQPIRSKLYTPIEVWKRTVTVLATVPPMFEAGWMTPPKSVGKAAPPPREESKV